jgi:hypothetical protein
VVIPFAFGLLFFNRIPKAFRFIVYLCGAWTLTEVAMFILRMQGISNAFLSYPLTAVELMLYSLFYLRTNTGLRSIAGNFFAVVFWSSVPLVLLDAFLFSTPLNTFSLTVEYILVGAMSLILFWQIVRGEASANFFTINLITLFYLLSSLPYFVAWECLRSNNMDLLTVLAGIHLYVHAFCYLAITFSLWRSSLSWSPR